MFNLFFILKYTVLLFYIILFNWFHIYIINLISNELLSL